MQQLSRSVSGAPPRPSTILQFGSGNFLRAFVDWMIQQSNDAGLTEHGVAVAYATNKPSRHDPLADQDGLYHVLLEGVRDGQAERRLDRIDVVQEIVDPFADYDAYHAIAVSPELKIVVSNTTEAGIVWRDDDLTARPPVSFPAQVAQVLHERYLAFDGTDDAGLAIVPCELIEDNGRTLRSLVVRHAEAAGWDRDFLAWLDRANTFYDTLVDRIVSGFPEAEADEVARELGVEDRALVKGELFSLWVIGGPAEPLRTLLPLDRLDVGVSFVDADEVGPFRSKKVRVLNGAHTALALLGLQLGAETVDQAYGDPDLRRFIDELISEEVLPTIDADRAELDAFAASILERFDNASLHHRLADISLNSGAKWSARNLPVLLDRWRVGREAPRVTLTLAALLVLYSGHSAADGFVPHDDAELVRAIADGFDADEPRAWVERSLTALGLGDLDDLDRLTADVTSDVTTLLTTGVRAAFRAASA
ncbi:tagaturonate reductase [Nigerium massiliense]|uniref:tagaturonate reductase n=1 Tax=Nigerium massiliense TaxID=1522317 RepID=UPI00058AD4E4|nr:tagaturonate reductase [Nigerium massiliense]